MSELRSCLCLMVLTLVVLECGGCKGGNRLNTDDFARMLKSGEVAAGKRLPEPQEYHYVWGELYDNAGTDGDRFFTGVARDRARTITIYTHNSIAFAACTVAEPRHDLHPHKTSPAIVWHFFDADLMKRHVEATQQKQREFETAVEEYRRGLGRDRD